MNEFESLLRTVVSSDIFLQIFPYVVLFLFPLFLVTAFTVVRNTRSSSMGLESFGFSAPWTWFSNGNTDSRPVHSHHHHHHQSKRKGKMSKRDVVAKRENGVVDGYYPGLVNISGTYCFMNSTVQALSSLSYLQPQIETVRAKAEVLDVPTPVIDVLQELFHQLNTAKSTPSSIRPLDLIAVLSNPSSARFNSLFNSREHQDAQELFQLVSECIKSETTAVDKEGLRDRGLNAFSQEGDTNKEIGKSVFDGLTANRRSCVICKYTEAVMHFAFDNWQLAVPRLGGSCTLDECLQDYTRLEVLRDCICRKCSMLATYKRLLHEVAALQEATQSNAKPSASKKRRLKEMKKMVARVKAALDEGRIEEDMKDLRMEKVLSQYSTKQAMIARPPPVLALHLNRSVHYSHYAAKNNIQVLFPEVLDLTPFTTSGHLSIVPTSSLSEPSPIPPRSSTPTPTTYDNVQSRTIYRLAAVVCHYGAHSFGHYVCFRRKPRDSTADDRWRPPKLIIRERPVVKEEDSEAGPAFLFDWEDTDASGPERGWLRISDSNVDECGIESVLREGSGAFMLYYERAQVSLAPPPHPYARSNGVANGYAYGVGMTSPESSEETLKPERLMKLNGNASMGSLVSRVSMTGSAKSEGDDSSSVVSASPPAHFGARVVRSTTAGRGRSTTPSTTRAKSVSPPRPLAIPNGHHHRLKEDEDEPIPLSLSSSAPALLHPSRLCQSEPEPHNHKP